MIIIETEAGSKSVNKRFPFYLTSFSIELS